MGKVILDMSMSLDGFVTGPDDNIENPMGHGGERLHEWLFSGDTASDNRSASVLPGRESFKTSAGSSEVLEEMFKKTGAVIMGRRWFDIGEKPWGDDPPFHVPVFVITHHIREKITKGETTFTFVTEGIVSALKQAKAAARKKNVSVGAAKIAQQFLKEGLLDEIHIHLVPVLLGDGRRLFHYIGKKKIELEKISVIDSPGVTHIKFRVLK